MLGRNKHSVIYLFVIYYATCEETVGTTICDLIIENISSTNLGIKKKQEKQHLNWYSQLTKSLDNYH